MKLIFDPAQPSAMWPQISQQPHLAITACAASSYIHSFTPYISMSFYPPRQPKPTTAPTKGKIKEVKYFAHSHWAVPTESIAPPEKVTTLQSYDGFYTLNLSTQARKICFTQDALGRDNGYLLSPMVALGRLSTIGGKNQHQWGGNRGYQTLGAITRYKHKCNEPFFSFASYMTEIKSIAAHVPNKRSRTPKTERFQTPRIDASQPHDENKSKQRQRKDTTLTSPPPPAASTDRPPPSPHPHPERLSLSPAP